ncbi:hypothetical protein QN277_010719 [Acacia crassicarpa]|nr:hypothetical protein QN277_010719 [Acacia crassicarpa]
MARNASLDLLFFLLILFGGSHPSLGWELRKLCGADPNVNGTTNRTQDPPLPTADPKPSGESGNNNKTVPPSPSTVPKANPASQSNSIPPAPPPLPDTDNEKASGNSNTTSATPPPVANNNNQKSNEKGKKKDGQTFSQVNISENCTGPITKCKDEGPVVACISESEPKYVVVIVQNGGDSNITVNLKERNIEDIKIAEHQNKKINVSVSSSEISQLTLIAGNTECVVHWSTPVPEEGIFLHFPSYGKFLTPVNGAYFLIVAVVIFGGTWGFCKLRKKRHHGVPYQELEMALPESVSATNVEVAEGWDQDWDDNWDEDVAVKSLGRAHAGSISANGLTARSSNRDGWENNWDD